MAIDNKGRALRVGDTVRTTHPHTARPTRAKVTNAGPHTVFLKLASGKTAICAAEGNRHPLLMKISRRTKARTPARTRPSPGKRKTTRKRKGMRAVRGTTARR